jgi:hypothetical protein
MGAIKRAAEFDERFSKWGSAKAALIIFLFSSLIPPL